MGTTQTPAPPSRSQSKKPWALEPCGEADVQCVERSPFPVCVCLPPRGHHSLGQTLNTPGGSGGLDSTGQRQGTEYCPLINCFSTCGPCFCSYNSEERCDKHLETHLHSQFRCYNLKTLSVQFNYLVMSDSLRPHGLQHSRPPCPSPTPGVYSDSCPSSQ